jgi:hypothetical protein
MIGDLLFSSRSVTFNYNRAAGLINVANPGSTSVVNAAIADNNSPLPADRVYFRFNYFDDAQRVTGFGPPVFDAQGVGTSFAQSRSFSLERYTFGFEKSFAEDRLSVEMRVPFSTTLSANLDLSAGTVTGPAAGPATPFGPAFGVVSTPQNTLGSDGTQFEDLSLIFKGVVLRREGLALSGGLGLTVPTGADTDVRVTDYSGTVTQGLASIQRVRDIHIDNETWALSPFVAALASPTERLFFHGFLELDFPLNPSTINYSDTFTRGTAIPPPAILTGGVPIALPPFATRTGISEQSLLHADLGAGYWLMRDPCRPCLTGIVPTLELHYTTTLQNASVVSLPGDGLFTLNPGKVPPLVPEPGPQIGSQRNRVDILDMTVGSTFVFSDRATLATGVSFPLRSGDNRTYDWEFHLQLNYYFGKPRF